MNLRDTLAILGFALAAAVIPRCAVGQTTGPVSDAAAATSGGGGSQEKLAKQLTNPVANLIVVPFRFDYDAGFDGLARRRRRRPHHARGPARHPLLPQRRLAPGHAHDRAAGLPGRHCQRRRLQPVRPRRRDAVLLLAPKEFGPSGWIWGAGPVFLWPTATNDSLGGEQWGVGPSGVVLYQHGPWTFRTLAGHIWSYAGEDDRADVNSTFLEPYLAYTTKDAWTFSVSTEMTHDWEAEEWTIPIDLEVNKLVTINDQPIQFGVGARYYADAPDGGPEWGLRFNIVFLFPKG